MNVMQLVNRPFLCGLAGVALLLAAGTATAQKPPAGSATLSMSDRSFINKVAEGGRAEVALGRLAQDKAADEAVKNFGRRMVEDHGRANRELTALLARKGMQVQGGEGAPGGLQDRLSKLSGREFDREYVREMVKDHQQDVAEFRRMSDKADDPDLKAWVAKTLPTLEEHLRMVEGLQNRVSASR